jgi:tetratricopeptide (TPR) repeat protein
MNRRERRAAAQIPQRASIKADAGTPAALCASALGHIRAQRFLDAQICCEQALAADADYAAALHVMGLLSLHAKQYDHAVEWSSRAIRRDPKPEYLWSLGNALQQQGRHEEALKVIDKAIQLRPDIAGLWTDLGVVLVDLERPDEALLSFQHALKLDPRNWDAAHKSALLLQRLGRLDEALKYFDLCNQLQPNHALALRGRAQVLRLLKRFEEALLDSQRSYVLDPGSASTCNNTGDILEKFSGRQEEALQWFDRALTLQQDYVLALKNKAWVLSQLRRFEEAVAIYRRLLVLDPDYAEVAMSLGHIHLLLGDFEPGWAGHQAQRKMPHYLATYPKFSQPMWLGEQSISGKTILVHRDEGLGDTIQYARYVPMLAARGARVILVVENPACALLSGLSGALECLPFPADPLPRFDFHCPMSSLPSVFGTRLDTIPSATSYLPHPPERRVQAWEDRLGRHDRPRVGLVWSGNPKHRNDHNRSTSLRTLSPILDLDATFVSLQKDPRPDDQATLGERTAIVDFTADLTDFVETSALISCLDLVITVDTSVAHLAAALGRPTWILLPYTPDYRWLLDRDDSPWYPTVRLFRQTETRDYGEVLDRVRGELVAMACRFVPAGKDHAEAL